MYNTFNGYMQGAQPYGNPYADRLAAMQQSQAMQQRCEVVTVNGSSDFLAAADGLDACQVLDLMDELMDTLQVIAPALYHSAMLRLDALEPSSSLPSEQASK